MTDAVRTRPQLDDPEVVDIVFAYIWPQVLEWLSRGLDDGDSPFEDPEHEEETKNDIRELIEDAGCCYPTGYKKARSLEDHGWEPDDALLEILMDIGSRQHNDRLGCVTRWVKEVNLQLPLTEGTKVLVDGKAGTISGSDQFDFCKKVGQYLVLFDAGPTFLPHFIDAEKVTVCDG